MIPEFDSNGLLPFGVWTCTGEDFLKKFLTNKHRAEYRETILNILDYAGHYGATSVLVGGSFVSNHNQPRDLDCVVLFKNEAQIPPRIESLDIGGNSIDVFFASADQPELVQSFLKLFSTSRFGTRVGVVDVQIVMGGELAWDITWEPDEEIFEVIRRTYIRRHFVEKTPRYKTLVTIHGLHTRAEWNAEVTLCASANGWLVAPFEYGFLNASILLDHKRRRALIDEFRDFLADITLSFGAENISVIAHSFGTYIACSYLLGFDEPPTQFDTLVMCGAIIDADLDLDLFEGKAANIINELAPEDEWVEWAKTVNLGQDKLFGYAGTRGFSRKTPRLWQPSSSIFNHHNVIRRDVIVQRWLPRLEANKGAGYAEAIRKALRIETNREEPEWKARVARRKRKGEPKSE